VDRNLTCPGLPAADSKIDIERIKLYAIADTADLFGGDQCRARPQEGIEHNVAAPGRIKDCISH
jgi:hypothetical protein